MLSDILVLFVHCQDASHALKNWQIAKSEIVKGIVIFLLFIFNIQDSLSVILLEKHPQHLIFNIF